MSDILEIIKSRRNVEKFSTQPVSWDKISKILDAGRHAPSCGNLQNWKFIVVDDTEKKQAIAECCHEQFEIIVAHALIVICAEPEKAERYYGLRGRKLFTIQNCAAAAQNMLLEAQSLGLGTRWIGAFEEDDVREVFRIPTEVRPQIIIAVGYPEQVPDKPSKYPLETIVYLNKWRNKITDMAKEMGDYSDILKRNVEKYTGGVKSVGEKVLGKVEEKAKPAAKSLLVQMKEKFGKKKKKDREDIE